MNIKKASELSGMTSDTIRYYERIGLIPPIKRNQAGIRDFSNKDLEILDFVRCYRSAGRSVESLIEYMSLFRDGEDQHIEARRSILVEEREKLQAKADELQVALARLDYKINNYEQVMLKKEKHERFGKFTPAISL